MDAAADGVAPGAGRLSPSDAVICLSLGTDTEHAHQLQREWKDNRRVLLGGDVRERLHTEA